MNDVFYSVGVDLAQSNDFTAISVIESQVYMPQAILDTHPWAGLTAGWHSPSALPLPALQLAVASPHPWPAKPPLHLRHLERVRHVPYPKIVARIATMIQGPPFTGLGYALAVDATGVGAANVDMLKAAGLRVIAIQIHGGAAVTRTRGSYGVPKRDLVSALSTTLATGRLRIADGLALGPELRKEAQNFRVKLDPRTAHDSYSHWRESDHDDIILSVAMAVWAREHFTKQLDAHRIQRTPLEAA